MAMFRANNSSGGGTDISDLIGNTYQFIMYTSVYQMFMAGISSIEIWSDQYGFTLYEDANKTNKIADVNTAHQTIDVSSYNIIYYVSPYSARTFNVKILG